MCYLDERAMPEDEFLSHWEHIMMGSHLLPSHWLLKTGHVEFRAAMARIVQEASSDVMQPDSRATLGYEDTQCQHFFSAMFTMFRERQQMLSEALACCAAFPEAFLQVGYYRSVSRRSSSVPGPQLVEKETGADFALTLEVDVPGSIHADRSVLGQAKLIDRNGIPISRTQLECLLTTGGPESAAYMMWGPGQEPSVITAQNVSTLGRLDCSNSLSDDVLAYGRRFDEFLLESFIGLWFGKDFDRQSVDADVPERSPTALYFMLHTGTPPPVVFHIKIGSARDFDIEPGLHVFGPIDMDENSPSGEEARLIVIRIPKGAHLESTIRG